LALHALLPWSRTRPQPCDVYRHPENMKMHQPYLYLVAAPRGRHVDDVLDPPGLDPDLKIRVLLEGGSSSLLSLAYRRRFHSFRP